MPLLQWDTSLPPKRDERRCDRAYRRVHENLDGVYGSTGVGCQRLPAVHSTGDRSNLDGLDAIHQRTRP